MCIRDSGSTNHGPTLDGGVAGIVATGIDARLGFRSGIVRPSGLRVRRASGIRGRRSGRTARGEGCKGPEGAEDRKDGEVRDVSVAQSKAKQGGTSGSPDARWRLAEISIAYARFGRSPAGIGRSRERKGSGVAPRDRE